MTRNRDVFNPRLLLGTLAALCALTALIAHPAAAEADEDPGCAPPRSWQCDNSSNAVPGAFIVFFHDWVEEDPEEIAREHIALNGGVLGFVYETLNGYSVSELTDAGAEAISADPRVSLMARDHYLCLAADDGYCGETPDPLPALPVPVPSIPGGDAATLAAPATRAAHRKKDRKRCRRKAKRPGKRCGRRKDGSQDGDASHRSTSAALRSGGKTG